MKIGILQTGHTRGLVSERHGDYKDLFFDLMSRDGIDWQVWDVVDMEFPASIHDADAWLLTGSPHGAYEDHAFIPPLEAFIRDAFAAKVPMIGICFGHQIIAQALGGKVIKFPGGWSIGRREYQLDGMGTIHLNAWHQDQVVEIPDTARVIASNDFCKYAGLVYGDSIMTLQPHPEISPTVTQSYVDMLLENPAYPTDMLADAGAKTHLPTDDAAVADRLIAFLTRAQKQTPEQIQEQTHG